MSTWKTRASAASIMGACVFAVASGAGAVFVGNWWGQHHSPVVIQYVDGPAGTSRAATSHAASVQKVDAETDAPPGQAPAAYPAQPDSAISPADPATWTSPATGHRTINPRGSAHGTLSASATATATATATVPATPSVTPSMTPTVTPTPTDPSWSPSPPPSASPPGGLAAG